MPCFRMFRIWEGGGAGPPRHPPTTKPASLRREKRTSRRPLTPAREQRPAPYLLHGLLHVLHGVGRDQGVEGLVLPGQHLAIFPPHFPLLHRPLPSDHDLGVTLFLNVLQRVSPGGRERRPPVSSAGGGRSFGMGGTLSAEGASQGRSDPCREPPRPHRPLGAMPAFLRRWVRIGSVGRDPISGGSRRRRNDTLPPSLRPLKNQMGPRSPAKSSGPAARKERLADCAPCPRPLSYLGPIRSPTKLISGYSSWGIITLSLTRVAGGLGRDRQNQ